MAIVVALLAVAAPAGAQRADASLVEDITLSAPNRSDKRITGESARSMMGEIWTRVFSASASSGVAPPKENQGEHVEIVATLKTNPRTTVRVTWIAPRDDSNGWLLVPAQQIAPAPGVLWAVTGGEWIPADATIGGQLRAFLGLSSDTVDVPASAPATATDAAAPARRTTASPAASGDGSTPLWAPALAIVLLLAVASPIFFVLVPVRPPFAFSTRSTGGDR